MCVSQFSLLLMYQTECSCCNKRSMYAPVTRSCWDTPSLCSRSVAIFSPSETSWPSLITTYTQIMRCRVLSHSTHHAPVTHSTSSSRKSPRVCTLSMCILVCPTRNSNLVFFTEPAETEVGCNQPRPQIATQPSSAQKVI